MENKLTVRDFLSEAEDKLAQEAIDLYEVKSDALYFKNEELIEENKNDFEKLMIKRNYLNQLWEMLEEIEGE